MKESGRKKYEYVSPSIPKENAERVKEFMKEKGMKLSLAQFYARAADFYMEWYDAINALLETLTKVDKKIDEILTQIKEIHKQSEAICNSPSLTKTHEEVWNEIIDSIASYMKSKYFIDHLPWSFHLLKSVFDHLFSIVNIYDELAKKDSKFKELANTYDKILKNAISKLKSELINIEDDYHFHVAALALSKMIIDIKFESIGKVFNTIWNSIRPHAEKYYSTCLEEVNKIAPLEECCLFLIPIIAYEFGSECLSAIAAKKGSKIFSEILHYVQRNLADKLRDEIQKESKKTESQMTQAYEKAVEKV